MAGFDDVEDGAVWANATVGTPRARSAVATRARWQRGMVIMGVVISADALVSSDHRKRMGATSPIGVATELVNARLGGRTSEGASVG